MEQAHAAIPIRNTDGLFHASAVILDPVARRQVSFAASLRARHDLSPDLFRKNRAGNRLYRKLGDKRRQDYGNVLSTYSAIETPTLTWHCEGDKASIDDLLGDAQFIGKKRASGFGEVAGWSCADSDLDGLVDAVGCPLRPIPVGKFEGDRTLPVQDAAWRPAYWDPANRSICYAPPLPTLASGDAQ